jgi:ribosomal protein S18 acetylase RimI-like enzyme
MEESVMIRPARPGEAGVLSALASRSKAHWGYEGAFLDSVRQALTVSEADVVAAAVFVLEADGVAAGFYRIVGTPPQGELSDVWLEPTFIGRGLGRELFRHALATAAARGFVTLVIESDPHAEGFYAAMGAQRIGERRSPFGEGRMLPLMLVSTALATT